ncbi:MAG: EAL domain-containing protein [Gammaproteobacteria bacterium]|nr:EAL domain-containing protein [Gammaproteobacteria bacterium]
MSFRTRILAALACVIACVLAPIFVVVYSAIRASMIEHAEVSLETGARVFAQSMRERDEQLLYAVRQAASDFGFKEAVATGDVPTIRSALENYNKRIGASEALVLSLEGEVVASTIVELPGSPIYPVLSELIREAEDTPFARATVVFGGAPHQLMAVPVEAPERVAWAVMGFVMDETLVAILKALTGLEISFVGYGKRGRNAVMPLPSTLVPPLRDALASTLGTNAEVSEPYVMHLRDAEYLTLKIPLEAGGRHEVGAVLQIPLEHGGQFRALGNRLVLISLLALGVALVAAFILAHGVARPLNRLVTATQRIAQGDYRHTVEIQRSDELGALATSLNTMQSAIAEREDRIAHQAFHDTLTGLPNRALAHDRLRSAIEHARRNGNTVGVLMIDVDRFKEINDTLLGHHTGDQLLIELGRRLRATVRASDTVARLGGDEFLTLVEGQNLEAALLVGAKLKAVMAEPVKLGTVEVVTEVSIGVSVYPDHGEDAEALLRRADIAMYEGKRTRQSPTAYKAGREEEHLHRLALVNDLRRAAPNNELVVHYQPKIELGTRAVTQVEALMRWRHPRYGMVPPDEFIPLAEQSGHIRALTHWLLDTVVRDCSVWRREGIEVGVAINISVTDLTSVDLPSIVEGRLREHGLEPGHLTLEVTESSVMRDSGKIILMLESLDKCGVRLSIDDFGTGYSSLSHLKRLPVHELKIDKSFVLDLMNNTSDAVIVKSTIDLGHNMGLRVVAEGVESEESLKLLRSYSCDMAQGFHISKALPLIEFIAWFKQYEQLRTASAPPATEISRIKVL